MERQENPPGAPERLPAWLRKTRDLRVLHDTKARLRCAGLSTVCEEARCPNISECFSSPTATFLILGDTCTRRCAFCSVRKGVPVPLDPREGEHVALAARMMQLRHIVITSVTRDDLPDRGALGFVTAIRAVREQIPGCTIEVLTPDFSGRQDLLEAVLSEGPDVFGHNVETTARLYPLIRPGSRLETSLNLLKTAREISPHVVVKSGFMVGLGESEDEIHGLLAALGRSCCDVVTIGQYLRPTRSQVPVRKYWDISQYISWSNLAKSLGIGYCIAGPFVRSSYHAKEVLEEIRAHSRERMRQPG